MNLKFSAFLLLGTVIVSGSSFLLSNRDTPVSGNSGLTSTTTNTATTTSSLSPTSGTDTANNSVTVTIYKPDSQCETLIGENVVVSQDRLLVEAVGKVIEQATSADFNIVGYRVNLDLQLQVATVDLRLSPNSQRQFVSLSFCEQLALFGSLRKTITAHENWQIKGVIFTQLGKEILF